MIVYLMPRAPFTKNVPRSDTLFGAIAWAIRLLYGEKELVRILDEFDLAISAQESPPFVISSLFPYFEDKEGKILFLPRPLSPPSFPSQTFNLETYQAYKRFLKIDYVSQSIFNLMTSGELEESRLLDDLAKKDGNYSQQAGTLMAASEHDRVRVLSRLTISQEHARNAINRLSSSTGGDDGGQLYYQPVTSSLALPGNDAHSGFYLLVRVAPDRSNRISDILRAAFRFLADKGLGGDTTIGRGHCDVEFSDEQLISDNPTGKRLVTLSLLHPGATDRKHFSRCQQQIYARLEKRKGFIESAYTKEIKRVWKPTLFMLGEGSTFPVDNGRRLYGSLFTDTHQRDGMDFRIRINGLAYTVGMKGEPTQ